MILGNGRITNGARADHERAQLAQILDLFAEDS